MLKELKLQVLKKISYKDPSVNFGMDQKQLILGNTFAGASLPLRGKFI